MRSDARWCEIFKVRQNGCPKVRLQSQSVECCNRSDAHCTSHTRCCSEIGAQLLRCQGRTRWQAMCYLDCWIFGFIANCFFLVLSCSDVLYLAKGQRRPSHAGRNFEEVDAWMWRTYQIFIGSLYDHSKGYSHIHLFIHGSQSGTPTDHVSLQLSPNQYYWQLGRHMKKP